MSEYTFDSMNVLCWIMRNDLDVTQMIQKFSLLSQRTAVIVVSFASVRTVYSDSKESPH